MNLRNDFTKETRALFDYNYECWVCGKNGWDALHHIVGRESNNPLNAAPVHNFTCHINIHGKLRTTMKKYLLQKTLKYFIHQGYTLEEKDSLFLYKYRKFYEA